MSNKVKTIIFYLMLFMFIVTVSFQANTADYDLFARLLQGKAFWSLGNILHYDIFSYTPTHIWYDHEWGSSVIFYAVFAKFGALGFLWLKAFLIFGIFFFIIEALKVRGVKVTTPYNFLFYFFAYHAAANAGYSNTIRCLLFSYLFFAIWIYLLERVRAKKEYYWLVTFVPMMLFWANIHGGCMAGFGLLVLYTIGEALNKKPFKCYFYTLVACALMTLVNPWGLGYVKFLWQASTMERTLIGEWQPTFFNEINAGFFVTFQVFFIVMACVAIIRLIMKRKNVLKIDYTKALVMCTMTYLSLRYTRHQPFFVLSAIVFLYDDFYMLFKYIAKKLVKSEQIRTNIANVKEVLVYSLVAIATLGFFVINKPQVVVNNNYLPIKPIEFIRKNNISGKLYVDFQYGSYAAYKLYPVNLIAMDGRYEEVYEDYMLPLFNNFSMQVGDKPDMFLEMFRPDIIVMGHEFQAEKALEKNKTYKKVYSDEIYSVFVDKAQAKDNYKLPEEKEEYYNKTLFDSKLRFTKLKHSK